jgi:hypothetical protein
MERKVWRRPFNRGDWVVFRRMKHTTRPGRRARDVYATQNGDTYDYFIDKFWVVIEVLADGRLMLQTRRGKTHAVDANDFNLRHANWWDRLRYRSRFAQLQPDEQCEAQPMAVDEFSQARGEG